MTAATRLVITPEDKELLTNELLVPSLIFINGLKYGWNFSDNLLQQEQVTDEVLIMDMFFEKDYSADELVKVQEHIEAILRNFFRFTDKVVSIAWEAI